jgi:hypothetical protein
MGTTATTYTPLTAVQFAARMAALFPNGWASPDAKLPGGAAYGLLVMLGTPMSFESGALAYAFEACLIGTAQNGALDGKALDFFGTGLYALPRNPGESDAAYSVRLLAALLPEGATRKAVSDAVQAVTGQAPRIIEPWRPSDTGVLDGGPGQGMMFYDIDNVVTPGLMTDNGLGYQGFIQSILPLAQPFGNNPTPVMDEYTMNLDVAGSSMLDASGGATPQGQQAVYNAINRAKCEGTIAWVQFVAPQGAVFWDETGIHWDQSGVTWT